MSAAVDTQSGVVVVVDDIGATWTLDLCTNTWTEPATTGILPPHGTRLVYDADDDLTYAFGHAGVIAFDVESAAWSAVSSGEHQLDGAAAQDRIVLDPHSRTVYVYNTGSGELASYDLATNRWANVDQGTLRPPTGVDGVAAFDVSLRRIVLKVRYHGESSQSAMGEVNTPPGRVYGQTWIFAPATGTWTRIDAPTPELFFGSGPWGGEMTYDSASRTSVVFAEGMLARFDATTGEWTTATPGAGWPPAEPVEPPSSEPSAEGLHLVIPQMDGSQQVIPITSGRLARTGHALVDDVVNGRLLVLGGGARDAKDQPQMGGDVWAYHVKTNTWANVIPPKPE